MIAVPGLVTAADVDDARTAAARKHPELPLDSVRLDRLGEGRCAQGLRVAPDRDEGPTVAALHAFIADQDTPSRASTTRSTSATPAAARPRSYGRSCGSRSGEARGNCHFPERNGLFARRVRYPPDRVGAAA